MPCRRKDKAKNELSLSFIDDDDAIVALFFHIENVVVEEKEEEGKDGDGETELHTLCAQRYICTLLQAIKFMSTNWQEK